MRTVRSAFPDFKGTIGELIAEGDLVAARVTWQGTHHGTFFGVEPTGRTVSIQAMHFMRMVDGRTVEWWGTADVYGALRQLGATVVAESRSPDRIE
jgi:predicted ester cyclase